MVGAHADCVNAELAALGRFVRKLLGLLLHPAATGGQ